MADYKKGKIYAIKSHMTDEVYIGSTIQSLNMRMGCHISHCKRGINISSKHILQHPDAYIELIEDYPCDTKKELLRREGEIINATSNCVNIAMSNRIYNKYRKEHKKRIKKYIKEYIEEQQEKVKEQRKRRKKELIKEKCIIEGTKLMYLELDNLK